MRNIMLEIQTVESVKYSVAALNKATTSIYKLDAKSKEQQLGIAYYIAETAELWDSENAPDDFDNVHAWTEKALGIKKTTSYDLLRIGQRFVTKMSGGHFHTNLLPAGFVDFSISQLTAMLPASDELLADLVDRGEINPAMTCRDIKKVIAMYKNAETETDAETETETDADIMVTVSCNDEGVQIQIPQKVWDKLVTKYAGE